MTARRAKLAAVKPEAVEMLHKARPEWAHPADSEQGAKHRAKYLAAIKYLRRNRPSRWIMDRTSPPPGWRMLPAPDVAVTA